MNASAALTATIPEVGDPSASASSAPATATGQRPDTGLAWYVIAFGILVGAVLILGPPALIVVPVVLLVRRSRRRRRAREQAAAAAWTPEEIR